MPKLYVGLDLGQAQDWTAISVIEEVRAPGESKSAYHLRHLERPALGTTYPAVVQRVGEIMRLLGGSSQLVVDQTGVGRPVVDLLRDARLHPIAITITGGDGVSQDGSEYHVPKRNLVSCLAVLFQSGRLKVAQDLPEAQTLVKELLGFKVKISTAGHDSYEAWREGIHDDMVLSVSLACWYAENGGALPFGWLRDDPAVQAHAKAIMVEEDALAERLKQEWADEIFDDTPRLAW